MDKVIDTLYKISSEFHGFLNGCGEFDETHFWAKGKIFKSMKEAYNFYAPNQKPIIFESYDEDGNSIGGWCEQTDEVYQMIDCRTDSVDNEMKMLIRSRLCMYLKEFYNRNEDNDDFLLVLGFSINLYYILGLYSTFGKFDIDQILEFVDSDEVKEYGILINEFLYSKIVEGVIENIKWIKFEDVNLYNETVDQIIKNAKGDEIEKLYESVKCFEKNYVPDIYMVVKENDFERKAEDYLNKMVTKYPEYRFGWVYRCVESGLKFYETEGQDIGVFEIKDKLGVELFLHILGMNALDDGKYELVNGKIETIRPAIFSEYGIGIPKIKTVNKADFYSGLDPNKSGEEDKRKVVTFTSIRKQTESILGINSIAHIDDNPMKYTSKLIELIEQQREALENNNKELVRLNVQRRNLVDHLAHSWGNECYPEIVKKVADELLRNGNNSLANRLFKAYNSENNLMGEIIFLQSAMDDEPGKLKEIFHDSFYISGKGKKDWKIQNVIEEALDNLVFSLLNYNGDKEKRNICQKKLCVKYSIDELAEDYSKRFENRTESMEESFVQWFSRNIFPITIKVDECWNKVNFGKTEYGKILMKNIFTELFTNVLFHGERMCNIVLDSTDDKLCIKVMNNIAKDVTGRKKGLNSLKEVIAKLNYGTSVLEDEGLQFGLKTENEYETVAIFAKELMFIDEEW